MIAFVAAVSALLGLAVGSFLNVVIHRVPRKESVVSPRSRCPGCGTELANRDNVPVVSWLLLRGRCRTCSEPISGRYPAVEVLTAVVFAAVGAAIAALDGGDQLGAVPLFLVLAGVLVAVSFIDIEHFLVPNKVLIAGSATATPFLVLAALTADEGGERLVRSLLGVLAAGGALLVLNLISPRGMGMGDVKLAAFEGAFLGWLGWGHVFLGLFLGFLLGSVGGLTLIALRLRTRKDHIPFAPFLAAGALLTVVLGDALLDIYSGG
jgi:leader peptidase (prepilin peptidase)/N-methyltransferase